MTRLLRIGIAALAVPATALVISPSPALAQTTPSVVLKLGPNAPLSSTGKLVKVRVNITCNNASPAPISAAVDQNRGSVSAHGEGTSGTNYKCNGRTQHVVVPVKVTPGQRFHTGGASATADVNIGGVAGHDARNIRLT